MPELSMNSTLTKVKESVENGIDWVNLPEYNWGLSICGSCQADESAYYQNQLRQKASTDRYCRSQV
jgi:hypothetical protein